MKKSLRLFLVCSTVISASPSLMGMNNNNGDPNNINSKSLNLKGIAQANSDTHENVPYSEFCTFAYLGEQSRFIQAWIRVFAPLAETLTQQYENPADDYLRRFSGLHFDVGSGDIFLIATLHDDGYFRELDAVWGGAEAKENLFIFSNKGVIRSGFHNKGPIKIMYRFGEHNGVGRYTNCLYVPKEHVSKISQRIESLRRPVKGVNPYPRYFSLLYVEQSFLSISLNNYLCNDGLLALARLSFDYERPADGLLRYFSGFRFIVGAGAVFEITTINGKDYSKQLDAIWNNSAPANLDENLLIFDNERVVLSGSDAKGPIKLMYRFANDDGSSSYSDCVYIPFPYIDELLQRIRDDRRASHERIQEKIRRIQAQKQAEQQQKSEDNEASRREAFRLFELASQIGNNDEHPQPSYHNSVKHSSISHLLIPDSIGLNPNPTSFMQPPETMPRANAQQPAFQTLDVQPVAYLLPPEFYQPSSPRRTDTQQMITNLLDLSPRQPAPSMQQSTELLDLPSPEIMQRFGYLPCLVQKPLDWLTKAVIYRLGNDLKALNGYNRVVSDAIKGFESFLNSRDLSAGITFIDDRIGVFDNAWRQGYIISNGFRLPLEDADIMNCEIVLLIRQYLVLFSSKAHELIASQSAEIGSSIKRELSDFKVKIVDLLTGKTSDPQLLSDMREGLNHGMELMYKLLSVSE